MLLHCSSAINFKSEQFRILYSFYCRDAIKGRRAEIQKQQVSAKRYHLTKLFTQDGSNVLVKVTLWTFMALMTAGLWTIMNTYRDYV